MISEQRSGQKHLPQHVKNCFHKSWMFPVILSLCPITLSETEASNKIFQKKYKKETWPNSYISSCLQLFWGTFHKTSKEKLYRHLFSLNQGSFNNYAKHREWVGLSVFQGVAWRKARGWVILDERPNMVKKS